MKKFFILDWSWYLFRAYYAVPELNDKNWNNINAVYGFFRMLFKLLQQKPDNFVIAWDSPTKTKRHEIFEQYKINRPILPDNFKWQIWLIKDIIGQIKIPYQQIPWYEADDIISCFVNNCEQKDIIFTIISSDKDLKQLLSDNVIFYDAMKNIIINVNSFIKENWFHPKNIIDYLSLVWDSSDNIPWVKWVWKVSAQQLILKYWNLKNLYNHLDDIATSLKQKLIAWQDIAFASYDLIKLYQIEHINKIEANDYKINLDFKLIKEILVDKYNFISIEKNINELKKELQKPSQDSLFT